jgi:hypothetical protein
MSRTLHLLVLAFGVMGSTPRAIPAESCRQDEKAEYERRRQEAEGDGKKLWEVADWCETRGLQAERRAVLRAILKLDDKDERAHRALGHVMVDGQWFTSERAAEAHRAKLASEKAKEEARAAKEQGLVRWKDQWVKPGDLPWLEKGYVKDDKGNWIDPVERDRLAQGWVRQDLEWVSPEEKPNLEKGLWKCGADWLTLDLADEYHASAFQWWKLPADHFVIWATCRRETALEAVGEMERAYADLVRIFGLHTPVKPTVVVLNSATQYSDFASGNVQPDFVAELEGLSSVHGAFFADGWFDPEEGTFLGAGVSYWDVTKDADNRFGPLWARHAAGQSYVDAIDPSPDFAGAVRNRQQVKPEDFWAEKKIPRWLRYGAAAYVERYFVDNLVGAGGDPYWVKKWSVQNILQKGGLDPIDAIVAFRVTVDDIPTSQKLYNEAGLIVAFMVDGKCEPVMKAHGEFKGVLKSALADPRQSKDLEKAVKALVKSIQENEDKLAAFAGI